MLNAFTEVAYDDPYADEYSLEPEVSVNPKMGTKVDDSQSVIKEFVVPLQEEEEEGNYTEMYDLDIEEIDSTMMVKQVDVITKSDTAELDVLEEHSVEVDEEEDEEKTKSKDIPDDGSLSYVLNAESEYGIVMPSRCSQVYPSEYYYPTVGSVIVRHNKEYTVTALNDLGVDTDSGFFVHKTYSILHLNEGVPEVDFPVKWGNDQLGNTSDRSDSDSESSCGSVDEETTLANNLTEVEDSDVYTWCKIIGKHICTLLFIYVLLFTFMSCTWLIWHFQSKFDVPYLAEALETRRLIEERKSENKPTEAMLSMSTEVSLVHNLTKSIRDMLEQDMVPEQADAVIPQEETFYSRTTSNLAIALDLVTDYVATASENSVSRVRQIFAKTPSGDKLGDCCNDWFSLGTPELDYCYFVAVNVPYANCIGLLNEVPCVDQIGRDSCSKVATSETITRFDPDIERNEVDLPSKITKTLPETAIVWKIGKSVLTCRMERPKMYLENGTQGIIFDPVKNFMQPIYFTSNGYVFQRPVTVGSLIYVQSKLEYVAVDLYCGKWTSKRDMVDEEPIPYLNKVTYTNKILEMRYFANIERLCAKDFKRSLFSGTLTCLHYAEYIRNRNYEPIN